MKRLSLLALLPFVLIAADAMAATRDVCRTGASYQTIGAAVAAAAAGDLIRICPGTYNESVSFTQPNLTLESSTGNRNDVVVSSNSTTFSISGANATIRNLSIVSKNGGGIVTLWAAAGTHLFQNLDIASDETGILVNNGGNQRFRQLAINSKSGGGIRLEYNANGQHLFEDLEIKSDQTGISVSNGGMQTFRGLVIDSKKAGGIAIENAEGAHAFEDVTVTARETAIQVHNSDAQTFRKLRITSEKGNGIAIESNADGAHVFEDIVVAAELVGIAAARGAALMKTIDVTSHKDIGVRIGSKYVGQFLDMKIDARKEGFQITSSDPPEHPHVFSNLDIRSREASAIHIAKSGTLSFSKVTASANGAAAIQLDHGANGFHTLSKLTLVNSGGKGLVAVRGLAMLENADIDSRNMAADIGNKTHVVINGLVAKSSEATAINFSNSGGISPSYSLKNVTVTGAAGSGSDGIAFALASQVSMERVCINSAGRYGTAFTYNTRNVMVRDSIFKGHGSHGIYLATDPSSASSITNSCFYKAPCAYSSSMNHDFSGNFWAPANCSNVNVSASSSLLACPLTQDSCYAGGGDDPVVLPGGFNAFESSTPAGQIAGLIKTKVAGLGFNLDVTALNAAKNAVEPGFTGNVKVELLGNMDLAISLDADNCPQNATVLGAQVVSFAAADSGRKNAVFAAQSNAWRNARVRISYPADGNPTRVACSTDNFAIRPAALAAPTASDANWETAGAARALNNTNPSGGVVHKAGRPFTLSTIARNATGTTTTNYAGSPEAKSIACMLPAPAPGCENGALSFSPWSGSSGTVSATANYSEAGSFALILEDRSFAQVDAGDSSETERYIPQAGTSAIGRFVPDHFALSGNTPRFRTFNDASCTQRSFTYIGQPFGYADPPVVSVAARNADNAITRNYSGSLWKLTAASVSQTYASTAPREADEIGPPQVSAFPGISGLGTIMMDSADRLAFQRNASTPQASFNADISLAVTAEDVSEVAGGHGPIASIQPLIFNGDGDGIAFDSGNSFRYGRLRLDNAHGSDLLNLSLPVTVQHWVNNRFVANADDHCTTIDSANIAILKYNGGLTDANLPSSHIVGPGRLVDGAGRIVISKPDPRPTARGSVDVCVDLGEGDPAGKECAAALPATLDWLKGAWTQPEFKEDPSARGSLGIYKGGPILYRREVY